MSYGRPISPKVRPIIHSPMLRVLFSSTIYLFIYFFLTFHQRTHHRPILYVLSLSSTAQRTLTAAPRSLRPAAARARPAQISSLLLASLDIFEYVAYEYSTGTVHDVLVDGD
jgi:hypothetical protein